MSLARGCFRPARFYRRPGLVTTLRSHIASLCEKTVLDSSPECELTTGDVELLKNKGGNDVGPILSVGENFTFVCFDEILTGFDNSATAHAMWNATPVQHSDNQLITVGP